MGPEAITPHYTKKALHPTRPPYLLSTLLQNRRGQQRQRQFEYNELLNNYLLQTIATD